MPGPIPSMGSRQRGQRAGLLPHGLVHVPGPTCKHSRTGLQWLQRGSKPPLVLLHSYQLQGCLREWREHRFRFSTCDIVLNLRFLPPFLIREANLWCSKPRCTFPPPSIFACALLPRTLSPSFPSPPG